MAGICGCLCLILTLWMAGSQRPAIPGTVDSDPWWGTKEAVEVKQDAERLRAHGDFAGAEAADERGYRLALARHNLRAQFVYLTGIGAARLYRSEYQPALEAFLKAGTIADELRDPVTQGIAAMNLSSLYLQTWDFDDALRLAEQGMTRCERSQKAWVRLPLSLQLGRLHQALDDGRAAGYFEIALEAARAQGNIAQEARAWDLLGEERLHTEQLDKAERDIDEAFRLRSLGDRAELKFSYSRLGALRFAQGEWEQAERFTDRALAEKGPGLPDYRLIHQRGEIRLARGNGRGALEDFAAAIDEAEGWRRGELKSQAALDAANVELEKRIFRSFIETAAEEALRTGDQRLATEAFEAAELNRAASLREIRALNRGSPYFFAHAVENFRSQSSLIHFQQGLGRSELFLSLYLGDKESYLWAVTRKTLSIHRLPAAHQIRGEVGEFRDAVRRGAAGSGDGAGSSKASRLGEELYAALFGDLSAEETSRPQWLLSLDDALFHLPFAALVERRSGKMEYLVERHSVQVVPGALPLTIGLTEAGSGGDGPRGHWFLGVGDPIYNMADARWQEPCYVNWFASRRTGGDLSRLVGSANEVEASARSWSEGATVLIGARAERDSFLKLAAREPAVIHLATHILASPQQDGSGAPGEIAFGLSRAGVLETLTTADIAKLNVPGAVVAMTGCESGGGEALPGVGLPGLTRAWEEAGAQAVIATNWPVSDTDGELFASFYRNLREVPAAEALRRSQVEMLHSDSRLRSPEYWAAFQVSGGHAGGHE